MAMASLARSGAKADNFRSWARSEFLAVPPEAIGARLREVFVYRDENQEVIRTVPWMFEDLQGRGHFEGDCDDSSTFTAAVFLALNLPVRFRAIRYSDPSEFQHVFVEVLFEGSWRIVDLTVPPGTPYEILESMVIHAA